MEAVGYFFPCNVFFFLYFYGINRTVTLKKKKKVSRTIIFLGLVFRMPTCLEVSQHNWKVILRFLLLTAVYWIAL